MQNLIVKPQGIKTQTRRLLLAVAMAALLVSHAEAATLKREVEVTGDVITVGDLFDGVTAHADYVLAQAPKPGDVLRLPAHDLKRVSDTFNLGWQPASQLDQAVVRSAAVTLERQMVIDALASRLSEDFPAERFDIQLPQKMPAFAREAITSLEVESLKADLERQTFEARLTAGNQSHVINGRVFSLVSVPVLKTAFKSGDLISGVDIEYADLRKSVLPADVLLDAEQLIGLTPRRAAMAGKPLQASDLEAPVMVKKGQTVTLQLKSGSLSLSLQGKAMQNGAEGDTVRVLNTASNQVVEGTVSGFQKIDVRPATNTQIIN